MATKLRNLRLTSVDLVRAGANQDADICLYKSADQPGTTEQPQEDEKSLFKRFIDWMKETATETEEEHPVSKEDPEEPPEEEEPTTFEEYLKDRTPNETLDLYLDALEDAIENTQRDDSLDKETKKELITDSLDAFTEAMTELIPSLCDAQPEDERHEKAEKSARFDVIEEAN